MIYGKNGASKLRLIGAVMLAAAAASAAAYCFRIASHSNTDFLFLIASALLSCGAAAIFKSEKLNKTLCLCFFLLFVEFFLRAAVYGRSDFFEYTVLEADARRLKYYFIHRVNLVPFKSIGLFFKMPFGAIFTNIFGNVGLIIPVSFLSPIAFPAKRSFIQGFFTGLSLSLLVELSQFFFMCGAFDVDDIILNSTGAIIGAALYSVWRRNKKRLNIFT